jgi:hypothetical protein
LLSRPAPLPHGRVTFDCGPEALSAVLQFYRLPADVHELTRLIYDPAKNGTYSPAIPDLARRKGLANELANGSIGRLKNAVDRDRPTLIMVRVKEDLFHFFVVVGYNDVDRVVVCEEYNGGKRLISFDQLLEIWRPARWCLEFYPAGAMEDLEAAEDLEDKGDYVKAAAFYQRVLLRERDSAEAWQGLANCLKMMGHRDNAVVAYEAALTLNPQLAPALISFADLLVEDRRDLERALWLCDRAVDVVKQERDGLTIELEKASPENRARVQEDLNNAEWYLAAAYGTLGQAEAAAGHAVPAISAFEASLALMKLTEFDRRAGRLLEMGDQYESLRMGHEARVKWTAALDVAQDEALLAKIRQRLK